jgi:sensor histidine kinase YesM
MQPTFNRTQCVLLYIAGWIPVLIFYAVGMRQTAAANYATAFAWSASYLLPGVLTGGLIFWVASRLKWKEMSWAQCIGIEVVHAFWFVVQWHVFFYAYLALYAGRPEANALAKQALAWQLLMALLIAAMHTAVFHALRAVAERRIKEIAAVESEALRVRAEMQALRGQLDPHFLFNSLHSITALVRENPARAEEALLQFAALLRRVLEIKRDSTDEILLQDELRFVDDYLAIERLRLGDRLQVERDIAPAALACWLPAFSVQPLVENAIGHAIAPRRAGGTLTLRAAVRAGRLEISVADNGPGADPAQVNGATGVGLSVIKQRLALRHGPAAQVTVDTKPGGGFRTTLNLPVQIEPMVGRVFDSSAASLSKGGPATRPSPA